MGAIRTIRRGMLIGHAPARRHYAKGDYPKWRDAAKAQLEKLFSVAGYLKHRSNRKAMLRALTARTEG